MTEPLIEQIMSELNAFIAQDGIDDDEKQWAQRQTTDVHLQQQLKQLSTTDIKIIAQLATQPATHAKALPQLTTLSQATISRAVTKLAQLGLVEKFRSLQNNKEVLVRLTTAGQQVAQLQHQLKLAIAAQASAIAADYTPAELTRFVTLMHRIRQIKP
ncbi:MarR family transcriptional regulator [Lactobacillus sp. CBA3605]|uniref:MarR family winged helix-turn-helix transcriptional regulator n=1 Tax=Lactobacillus sp. CBA3605 TaxID=2099788 RepID=UPI000CFCF9C5|nr:MarR family transcriptional regulator [Lactobacillus sp. CBA3605]AVK61604.1 MarR family transcriptional regulator [Lactobacillus sp. CBA3605]